MENCLDVPKTKAVVKHCIEKVRHFCLHDAYPKYDLVGRAHSFEPNVFQPELLTATNSAMMARSSRAAWAPFLGVELPELAAISPETDFVDSNDDEYAAACDALRRYYLRLAEARWITDMAASKMLLLKRPRLAAISDSYVREALAVVEPNGREFPWKAPWCAERALRVSDAVREVGLKHQPLLDALQSGAAEFGLSKARLIDILIWVDQAIAANHRGWCAAAARYGW